MYPFVTYTISNKHLRNCSIKPKKSGKVIAYRPDLTLWCWWLSMTENRAPNTGFLYSSSSPTGENSPYNFVKISIACHNHLYHFTTHKLCWFGWEGPSKSHIFECLLSSWRNCLGRIKKCVTVSGLWGFRSPQEAQSLFLGLYLRIRSVLLYRWGSHACLPDGTLPTMTMTSPWNCKQALNKSLLSQLPWPCFITALVTSYRRLTKTPALDTHTPTYIR